MLLDLEEKTRVLVEDIVERSAIKRELSLFWVYRPVRLLVELSAKPLAVKLVNEL